MEADEGQRQNEPRERAERLPFLPGRETHPTILRFGRYSLSGAGTRVATARGDMQMRGIRRIAIPLAAAVLIGCGGAPSGPPPPADLLIRGARIVDGTGGPWFRANLAVAGDTIVSVGPEEPDAARVIEADGLVLAPGFIDMHAHSEYGLLVDPRALSKTAQGVTTEVLGEHLSAGPVMGPAVDDPMMVAPPIERDWTTLGGYLDRLEFAEQARTSCPTSARGRCAPR